VSKWVIGRQEVEVWYHRAALYAPRWAVLNKRPTGGLRAVILILAEGAVFVRSDKTFFSSSFALWRALGWDITK